MQIKITILNNLRVIALMLALACYTQLMQAQVNDSLPLTAYDSVSIIKQLLKENLVQQLQQGNTYRKIEQGRLKELINDSTVTDSLGKLVLQQIQRLKNAVFHTGKSVTADALYTSKQILQEQVEKLIQTQDIKKLISQFTGIIKQPLLQWKGGNTNITGQVAPSLFNDGSVFVNNITVGGNWSVMGIPMGMQFMRQDFSGPENFSRNTFSFQFDREAYLKSLRNKIKLKIKGTDLLPGYNDALQRMKAVAMRRLKASLDSINTIYKGSLNSQLEKLDGAASLLKEDMGVLQDKLLSPEFLQNIEQKKNLLAQMQQQLNMGGRVNNSLYDSLLQSVQAETGVNKIINRLKVFKEDIQKSGLLEKLQQAERYKNSQVQEWLQDPDKLKSLAKEQLDLNGMQKFFLNINQLKMGTNTINLSPLTLCQYANNGFNAAFINNKTYLFIMAGKQTAFSNLLDNRLASPLFSTDNTAMGIRFGKGDITDSHTHISLFTYQQNKNGYNNTVVNAVPGSAVVATFSKQLQLNETHYLNVEISKSAHKYNNQQDAYDMLQQGGNLSKQLLSGENFMQQMAFTLQWNGAIKEKELSYDLHGTRIGKGYSNPGSLFLSRGMTEFGGSLKKNFLKNQLQVAAKGNYREYEYSNNSTKWRNYNFSFQAKWKYRKSQYISLRYQPYQSLRLQDDKKYSIGGSKRLSIEGNFRKRFGKINYQHTASLSFLKNNYQFDSIPVNNKSVLISSVQTITINNRSYFVNLQYSMANKASEMIVFNTQLNADAGCMYSICKAVMGSTSINYNSTKGWFKQLGIKQTISGQLGERVIVSIYADIIKNIKEYRPSNMGNTRFDWSLQYLLK